MFIIYTIIKLFVIIAFASNVIATETNDGNVILATGMLGTGSTSLKSAIDIVSINSINCYDIHHITKDIQKWKKIISNNFDENYIKSIYNDVFPITSSDGKQSRPICITDAGFALPQLLKVFPKAKVILTTRDFESWFYNYVRSFLAIDDNATIGTGNRIYNVVFGSSSSDPANVEMKDVKSAFIDLWSSSSVLSSANLLDKATLNPDFNKWAETVRKLVPKDQLLEIQFGDGDLNSLCTFLNCDSKAASLSWKYYPYSAESEAQEKYMKQIEARNFIGLLIGLIALLVLIWLFCFVLPSFFSSSQQANQAKKSSSEVKATAGVKTKEN